MAFDEYRTPDAEVRSEEQRLSALSSTLDPETFRLMDRIGVTEGSICLEAGAASGTISRGLAERVGSTGRVWSIDKDLRFHQEMPPNVEVHEFDLVTEELPSRYFDFVHTRAVLQHIPQRHDVFDRLAASTKPGGSLLVEDSDMRAFAEQPLPEPYGTVHRLLASGTLTPWRDPNFGTRLLECFTRSGFEDLAMEGVAGLMRAGEPSGEWWFLMVDRVLPQLVEASFITSTQADASREQIRDNSLTILGPLLIAMWGRRPSK